ncbi:MAG TPA: 6,7-dimethyl-8-ribityllumazine synthase [Thermoanaerobaculia bacterium]|nr:6,7-dimethyl-8-ribityllumazine synthase [Thermoanaerobaculia bacterium]
MPRSFEGDLAAQGSRFAIVAARFNDDIVSGLLDGALMCLARHGADDEDIALYRVPGAFEIPTLAAKLAGDAISGDAPRDAIIALGCLLRGDTPHFDFISAQVTSELSRVSCEARFPIAFGVITCNTREQAVERSSEGTSNKGWEAALAAIEMANLWRALRTGGI